MADAPKSCCIPQRSSDAPIAPPATFSALAPSDISQRAILIEGARAMVGTNMPRVADDGEGPLRQVKIKPFRMGATTVTNAEFREFVSQTGYVTEAETFGWSFVFWSNVPEDIPLTRGVQGVEWWRRVDGANWRDVNGPGTAAIDCIPDHPVTQVSWNDAVAYAAWVGGRLPSEAEWEHAARGGLGDVKFPWGNDDPDDTEFLPCNIWQGHFPQTNTAADGFHATAPARSYAPNGYGLYSMVGNVWEWTAEPFKIKSLKKSVRERMAAAKTFKLSKGGSFLCHRSYCYRYRIAARSGTSPDSTTSHQGFRVVWDT